MSEDLSYPLVAATWDDAHGTGNKVYDLEEIPHEPIRVTTFGMVIKSDDKGISIAGEVCGDGTIRNHTFIPRSMLVNIVTLRTVKPRKTKKAAPSPEEVVGKVPPTETV